jgi:hypothetical protein
VRGQVEVRGDGEVVRHAHAPEVGQHVGEHQPAELAHLDGART